MSKLKIVDLNGKEISEINTPKCLMVEFNPKLIEEVYHFHSFNRRQATYGTLNRSELSYSGKKLWQQKRTGRARIGERGAVHHRGGNVCFGPDGRLYNIKMPKKKVRKALFSLLTKKLELKELIIVNNLQLPEISTKKFTTYTKGFNMNTIQNRSVHKGIFVDNIENKNLLLSLRNIPNVDFLPDVAFNVYDFFGNKTIVMSQDSLNKLEKLYEA